MVAAGIKVQMKDDKPGLMEVVLSVSAAALGVQNSKNQERDFTNGSPLVFIVAGLIFTIIFVVTIVTIVHLVT
jgi:hypothetical protein